MFAKTKLFFISKFIMLYLVSLSIAQETTTLGDVTLPPNSFQLGNFLTINYEFNSDNTITMAIQCNRPNQFFGVGLGNSMVDSDIWVFEIVGTEVTVNDYHSSREQRPSLDTTLGGQNELERLGYEITPTYTLVKIKRALDTGDAQNDKVIQPGTNNFIYATANAQRMEYHGSSSSSRGNAAIDLLETPTQETASAETNSAEESGESQSLNEEAMSGETEIETPSNEEGVQSPEEGNEEAIAQEEEAGPMSTEEQEAVGTKPEENTGSEPSIDQSTDNPDVIVIQEETASSASLVALNILCVCIFAFYYI